MKRLILTGVLAAVLGAAFLLGGCHRAATPQESAPVCAAFTIGVSFSTTDLVYRTEMLEQLQAYAADHPELRFEIRDGESSQKKQNQDMLELIAMPVDGIILIPYTLEGPVPVIHYANEKQIPVLTLDNQVTSSATARTIGYVGADHREMGHQAAELLVQSLEQRFSDRQVWNVLYLTGVAESSGALERDAGIRAVLEQNDRIRVLGAFNGEFTSGKAQSIVEDCLNVYPDIHGVICQNDLMAEGCCTALEERGLAGTVSVIGIDGQRSVVERIAEGKIDGTVFQNPDMMLDAVCLMQEYLQGAALGRNLYEPTAPITAQNAMEYLKDDLAW